ncbi:hypothetical protein P3T35_003479 [Kitasatospora sp. GP30]|uniref:DUF6542 domain-containing protein n=1 Tax=Kitasatospora sp. GP30 TaxID=3035084 RepID=UPI000C713782|nr:DUF6542 domain-containing protein [Kitasatospora sp. GP30]MDH6141460.1 hypothetical protein [Kitasatospora sp. GP30]
MAGQRTPAGDATARGYAPAQRSTAEGAGARSEGGRPRQRAEGRRPVKAQARPFSGTAVLLAVGTPVAGGLVDELLGLGIGGWGLLFCSVVGFAGAAWVCSRAGWWWVLPAPPPIVLAVTAGAEYLAHSDKYQDGKAAAAGAAKWAVHGFPVMLYAMGAALLVIMVRVVRDRRSRRG